MILIEIKMEEKIKSFQEDNWIESKISDFREVSATNFDHPIPSSVSSSYDILLFHNEI